MRSKDIDTAGSLRTISGVVTGTGAIAWGTGFTVIKGATGAFTVQIPGFRFLRAAAGVVWGNVGFVSLAVTQPGVLQATIYNSAAVATDLSFSFEATGMPL